MPMKRNGSEINSDTCSDDEIESGMANNVTNNGTTGLPKGRPPFLKSAPLDQYHWITCKVIKGLLLPLLLCIPVYQQLNASRSDSNEPRDKNQHSTSNSKLRVGSKKILYIVSCEELCRIIKAGLVCKLKLG